MTLQLRAVTKVFAGSPGGPHRAVDAVSLDIGPGTFCTLLGPSGCGKTTLLRIIAGFEEPTSGDVLHDGRSLAGVPPYRRGFPMVFQSYALFPHMTVLENVAYGLRVRGVGGVERVRRAAAALALLGLETQREKHPAQLSGGQQQRVALARCLVLEPRVILLDEPLSNLDAGLRVEMRREIRSLQQRLGITALYVTHDQEEALAVSDRIVVMNGGRIEQDGAPAEVYHRPRTAFVARFMGNSNVFAIERTDGGGVRVLGAEYAIVPPPDATHAVIRSDALVPRRGGRHAARIAASTFLGNRRQHVLHLQDGSAVTVDETIGAAGESVWLSGAAGSPGTPDYDVAFDLLVERLHFVSG